MIIEARTPEGTPRDVILSRDGAVLVQAAQGQYADLVRKGKVWIATTAVGGVAPGTVLSNQPPFVIQNPAGSGKLLSILKARLGYISGTLGAGTIMWAALTPGQQTSNITGGTGIDPVNALTYATTGSIARIRQSPTALAATPGALMPAFILGAFAGGAAPPNPPVDDFVDGAIVVPQGGVLALQGVAGAGTSPLVQFAVAYAEIDP